MNVKFANGEVPIWKLRKGTVVKFQEDYYHIISLATDNTENFGIHLGNYFDDEYLANSKDVTWLEPF